MIRIASAQRGASVLFAVSLALASALPVQAGPLDDLARGTAYELEGNMDDSGSGLWTRTTLSTSAHLSGRLRFAIGGYVTLDERNEGRYGGPAAPGTQETHGRYAEVTTLNLALAAPDFSLLAGKGELAVGVADLQSPTDRFDARDYSRYLHTRRLGRWQFRLDRALDDDTLTLAILPFEEADRYPQVSSGDPSITALLATPWDRRKGGIADGGVLVRYGAIREGYDFFVGAHFGPGGYPTLRREGSLGSRQAIRLPDAASAFVGAVATLDNWRLYGEALYQHSHHGADQSFLRYTLGTSARLSDLAAALGLQDLDPTLEYAGERVSREATDSHVVLSSEISRPYRDTLLAKLRIKPHNDWTLTLAATRPFDGAASSRIAGLDYQWSDDLVLTLRGGVRGETPEKIFGTDSGSGFFMAGFDYKF